MPLLKCKYFKCPHDLCSVYHMSDGRGGAEDRAEVSFQDRILGGGVWRDSQESLIIDHLIIKTGTIQATKSLGQTVFCHVALAV